VKPALIAIIISLVWFPSALATPLEDRWVGIALDTPIDSTGDNDSYASGGAFLVPLARGYLEPGVEFSYGRDEFKFPRGHNTRGVTYGPRVDINVTPGFVVTPFFSLSYLRFAGDLNDRYNYGYGFRFGLKVFASPFASANLQGRSEGWKAKNGGINSSVRQISIGISFYWGERGGEGSEK
jgi:hypothetical protein